MSEIIEAEFVDRAPAALAVKTGGAIAAPQLLDALRPAERVALMTEISDVVADVIEKKKWYKQIGPKKHILIEGWIFVGSLGGCSVKTMSTEKIEDGYRAHAVVVRVDSGIEVGAADQVCLKTESKWKGKDDYALIGMASTRACSRALSTVFRHVVELAGYSATPAEEMNANDPPLRAIDPTPAAPTPTDLMLARMVTLGIIPQGARETMMAFAEAIAKDWRVPLKVAAMNAHMDGIAVDRAVVQNTDAMRKKAMVLFGKLGYDEDARHDTYEGICGEGVRSWAGVVKAGMAGKVLDMLERSAEGMPE